MQQQCEEEIVRLHRVIEDWLNGNVPCTEQAFSAFRDALAEDFRIIHPSGRQETREQVASDLHAVYGAADGKLVITIRNIEPRLVDPPHCLLTYEEWQVKDRQTARLSTVLFRQRAGAPAPEWLHLHETWLAGVE